MRTCTVRKTYEEETRGREREWPLGPRHKSYQRNCSPAMYTMVPETAPAVKSISEASQPSKAANTCEGGGKGEEIDEAGVSPNSHKTPPMAILRRKR